MFVHVGMLYCLVLRTTPPALHLHSSAHLKRESRFRENVVFLTRSADYDQVLSLSAVCAGIIALRVPHNKFWVCVGWGGRGGSGHFVTT